MKILILLTLALITTATARIGESVKECHQRYGKPLKIDKETQTAVYKKAGFHIFVTFWKGTSHQILIQSAEKDELDMNKKISDAQVNALLRANLGKEYSKPSQITAFDKAYNNTDETIIARHNSLENWLMFSTVKFHKHQEAKKAKKEQEALKDF